MTRFDDGGSEPFVIGAARVTASTAKALKVRLDPSSVLGAQEIWLPKSVVHDDSEVFDDGGEGELVVQRWFARKEGWESE